MKVLFDQRNIVPEIPGLLLLSHGPLALSIIESAELIAGEFASVGAISLEEGDSPDAFAEEYVRIYEALPKEPLILLDLYGGTPCNIVMRDALLKQRKVLALGGLSLPMLIEAKTLRESLSGQALLGRLEENSKDGIVNVSEALDEMLQE